MHETEIKLSVHSSFIVPTFEGSRFRLEDGEILDLRATYHDTSDLRLARHGATLRYRTGETSGPTWTLKLPLPGTDARVREEQNFTGSPTAIPEDAKDLTTALTRSESLTPVARLRTRRKVWWVTDEDGKRLAELSDDEVSILENRRVVARFRELEVEVKDGTLQDVEEIAGLLLESGAVAAEPIPKAVRALGPRATAGSDLPAPREVSPKDPAAWAVQGSIARAVRRLITHDPLARMGEVEGVHQMRVAARTLRSDLRTFATLLHQDWAERISAELKWLAGALGEVRDLDVQQGALRKDMRLLGRGLEKLFAELVDRRTNARERLLEVLRSGRYRELLEQLVAAAREPVLTPEAAESCEAVLPGLVEKVWTKLKKGGRDLEPDSPEESFHDVRIRAKRTRYAAEAIAAAMGGDEKDARSFARLIAGVQDELGAHQDASVAQTLYLDFGAQHPNDGALNLALGRLIERQVAQAERSKETFFEAWKKLDRKKNVRWLES